MARVKKGMNALKTRKNILRKVKGFRYGRSKKEADAYEALVHAGTYAFAHRRDKKGVMRRLWSVKINAMLREYGQTTYSKFIGALKKKNIEVDRKIFADLAENNPETFKRVLAKIK